jgi:hypothetical protein
MNKWLIVAGCVLAVLFIALLIFSDSSIAPFLYTKY